MQIRITINDPKTVELLQRYGEYVAQVDSISGSIDELAEGLVLSSLDEHWCFRNWLRAREVAA